MSPFPMVDPIPLPAPVWLFKGLHILTLALHFVTVEMLLGGLLVAAWLNFLGARGGAQAATRLTASAAMARRLPIVMTYVINLGVPPLLFAQVLYGRALYTSSVLIGVWWISVVFLLMACYWLLYRFAARAEAGRSGWWIALLAWLIAGAIAKIYSTNMTLMLHPEVWGQMYSATAAGYKLPPHEPTLMARWLYMLAGGLVVAGLWMVWLSARKNITESARNYLATRGGALSMGMCLVLAGLAYWVVSLQPDAVRQGLSEGSLYPLAKIAWFAGIVMIIGIGAWNCLGKPLSNFSGGLAALAGVVLVGGMTVYRDGIRDLTLAARGFNIEGADLWQRAVHVNWPVVILFLLSLVASLGVMAWLISVVVRAKPVEEKVNP